MHADLKLGLTLVAAAALLEAARSGIVVMSEARSLDLSAVGVGWLATAGGIGGLAVVGAAVWVDRRPPRAFMAAGGFVVALGIAVVGLSNGPLVAALGMFIVGVGGAAVGSLVFYAVAVKGATRYRGALIGALGMVFTMGLGPGRFGGWPFDSHIHAFAASAALALLGGALLFRLLPRTFTGPYEHGKGLMDTLSTRSVRRSVGWGAVAFLVASIVIAAVGVILSYYMLSPGSGADDVESRLRIVSILSGVGVLLWGIAADFCPLRRLFLLVGLLLLPATVALWALDGPPVSTLGACALGVVSAGLVCLPWVLLAESLPNRHFASIAVAIVLAGGLLGGTLGASSAGILMSFQGFDAVLWLGAGGGILVALVASRLPRSLATESLGR